MSTTNRKLRLAFKELLTAKGIDDLQLEIDLTSKAKEILGYEEDGYERRGTLAALEVSEERKEYTIDASDFPPDVREVVLSIFDNWMIRPPGKKLPSFSSWIKQCRDILDACGEFHVSDVIRIVKQEYDREKSENGGRQPFMVAGPSSLVKPCRAKAAQMREGKVRNEINIGDASSFNF